METNNLLAPLFFVLIRLMGGAILKFGLKKMPLPYTVGLFAFGLLIGTFDRIGWLESIPILKSSIDFAGNANPDMILYIFLPILIFDAAYELDVHIFRKTLTNATILSVPGVIIAMLLTAALMIGIGTFAPSYEGWNWTFALMFGALISATDPVAVVALLKELGTSKRFSTLVDAESMLNDGTGIVLFMLFFGAYTATGVSDSPVADFIMVVAGGALVGTLLAYLCIQFITKVNGDEMLQNSVMILSAYMTFVIAQNYLEVSGVIALVGFGLAVSYMGRLRLKPQVNKFMRQFWELAAHIANTLIFIIVGIVIALKVDFSWMDLLILICVYAGINIIRILTINATTIGWLLKKLGLAEIPSSKLLLDYSVKKQLYEGSEKYLKDLKQKEALEATDWSIVEQFLPQKEIYPEMPVRTKDVMADIRLRILDRERSLYWSLYTNGVISSGTQRRLNAAIDEQYDRDGKKPLCDRGDIFEFCEEPSWIISMKFFSRFFQKWADIYYQDRIILGYDLARGLIIAQKESLKLVNEFGSSETVSTEYESCLSLLQVEIRKNITRASNFITKISIDYPKSYKEAVTRKSVRMLLSNEKKRIEQFKEQGLISQEEAEQMVNELGERHNKVFTSYQFLK